MSKRIVMVMLILFILGWLSHSGYSIVAPKPLLDNENIAGIIGLLMPNSTNELQRVFVQGLITAHDKPSPKDRIKEEQIKVMDDKVVIDIKNTEWAKFTDTDSMDPVIDVGTNAIEIVPESQDDLQVGDIVSYTSPYTDGIIIHRIVEIGNDSEWYARVKGDNIDFEDPGKVRFDQIQRVVIGIIY